MAYFEDLGTSSPIAEGPFVRAIGWLAAGHRFSTGTVTEEFRDRLMTFVKGWNLCTEALAWPVAAGPHRCELCGDALAAGNFGVPAGSLLYVCPEMLGHYVNAHRYQPPDEFVRALLSSPLPGTDEYTVVVSSFRQGNLSDEKPKRAFAR